MAVDVSRYSAGTRRRFEGLTPRLTVAVGLCNRLPPYSLDGLRVRLLRIAGVEIGEGTGIGGALWIAGGRSPARRIRIGSGCFINDGVRFDVTAPITIEDGVYLGHEVAVITATHEVAHRHQRAGAVVGDAITIGRGAWIGTRATILPGVTIGAGSIVGAGAVVTKSVRPNTVVGGVPARKMRELASL